MTGLNISEAKILNTNHRIRKCAKFEGKKAAWLDHLEADRKENEVNNALKAVVKAQNRQFRRDTLHTTQTLRDALFIGPTKHLTMGKVRKYCIEKGVLNKKDKMGLREANLVQRWNSWFPNSSILESDDEESSS